MLALLPRLARSPYSLYRFEPLRTRGYLSKERLILFWASRRLYESNERRDRRERADLPDLLDLSDF